MKSLEQKVITRVKRIYYLRKVINPTALKIYGLFVLTTVLTSAVSLANVYANMPSVFAPSALINFLMSALSHTEFFVQILLAGLVATMVMLGRDVVRNRTKTVKPFAHA